jgi:hypothetical protein
MGQDCSARDISASSFQGYLLFLSPSMRSRNGMDQGSMWFTGGYFCIVADGVLRINSLVFC